MEKQDKELDSNLRRRLDLLHDVPPRDARAAALGRSNYLAEARTLAEEKGGRSLLAVLRAVWERSVTWIRPISRPGKRAGRFSWATALSVLAVILVVLLGGTAVSVYAAQNSLPASPLYPVKLLSEDLRLDLAPSTQGRLDLVETFTDRRIEEIKQLSAAREAIPQALVMRLQQQEGLAFEIAAGMDDAGMIRALEQIEANLRLQDQEMVALQAQAQPPLDPVLNQVHVMLREQIRMAELGLADPQDFRLQLRRQLHGEPVTLPTSPAGSPMPGSGGVGPGPGPGSGAGPGASGTLTPTRSPAMDGSGPGPMHPTPTPAPAGETSTPKGPHGPGPGGMMATPTPTPGESGSGSAPTSMATRTPAAGGGGGRGGSASSTPASGGPVPTSGQSTPGGGMNSNGGGGKP